MRGNNGSAVLLIDSLFIAVHAFGRGRRRGLGADRCFFKVHLAIFSVHAACRCVWICFPPNILARTKVHVQYCQFFVFILQKI